MIVVRVGGRLLLLDSRFDPELDDYGDNYRIYALDGSKEILPSGSWESLPLPSAVYLGEISLNEVRFDETKRREIDTEALESFLSGLPSP